MKNLRPHQVLNSNLQRKKMNHQAHLSTHILRLRKSLCLWRRKLLNKLPSLQIKNKKLQNRSKKSSHLWTSTMSKYRVIPKAWSRVLISVSKCLLRELRVNWKTATALMIPSNLNTNSTTVIELTSLLWTCKPWASVLLLLTGMVFIFPKKASATPNLNMR